MPFSVRHRTDAGPRLEPLPDLEIRHEADPARIADLQGRSVREMTDRVHAGHRAWVAWRNGEPAAWGWVATRTASIGELDSAFTIPTGDRYLWNFVTLPRHRGLGIYPRLLDAIVRAESHGEAGAERFWIAHAPENHASGIGIAKAGFAPVAELSFDAAGRPALRSLADGGAAIASRVLGLPIASDDLAQCWRCVRAGRGSMSCAPGRCRCDYQVPKSGCAA